MRYSLLNFICCSHCGSDLTFVIPPQEEGKIDDSVEIKEGLLTCEKCRHWFPIHNFIPELLPDHLRDWEKDLELFKTLKPKLPEDTFKELLEKSQSFAGQASNVKDEGINYKKSEISIKEKVTEEGFFGPGFSAPFNPGNPEYTMHLIQRLGNVVPLLDLKEKEVVLDIGAGYAWTTEWLKKMGMEPIGVDITRTYLDIGVQRMGDKRPHLVVGDIENLPIKNHVLNAVLCYDAFHHIPDRKKAMGHFYRTLKENGNIVLAEPGGTHEFAKVSREVMNKYGILEKGMELDEVKNYCEGLNVIPPEQHFVLKIQRDEQNQTLSPEFVHAHSYVDCNVYVIRKRSDQQKLVSQLSTFKGKMKQKVKRLLKRMLLKLLH